MPSSAPELTIQSLSLHTSKDSQCPMPDENPQCGSCLLKTYTLTVRAFETCSLVSRGRSQKWEAEDAGPGLICQLG